MNSNCKYKNNLYQSQISIYKPAKCYIIAFLYTDRICVHSETVFPSNMAADLTEPASEQDWATSRVLFTFSRFTNRKSVLLFFIRTMTQLGSAMRLCPFYKTDRLPLLGLNPFKQRFQFWILILFVFQTFCRKMSFPKNIQSSVLQERIIVLKKVTKIDYLLKFLSERVFP